MGKKLPREQADEVRPEEPTIAEEEASDAPEETPVEAPSVVVVTATEASEPPAEPLVLTPAEWAVRKGHANPTDPRIRGIDNFKAWVFEAAKHHAGWGTRVALNKPIDESEYDAAVGSALSIACKGQ